MAAVNTDASRTSEEAEPVRVGVVFPAKTDNKDCVVSEDGQTLVYTSAKNRETQTFSFDQVVNVDNIQSFHSDLLASVIDSVSRGFIVSLLVCGVCSEEMCSLIDHSIIKQLLANLFSRLLSQVKEEPFISVSFIQFYPDGSAVDLLSPQRQTLKPVTHPVLGRLIEGVCEVCVATAEDACALYETGRRRLRSRAGAVYGRCSSLFSVAVEWKLHREAQEEKEEKEEQQEMEEVCRSRLQLFSLAGRASRTDLRGVNPLVTVLEQLPHVAPTAERFLPGLLHEALTGNSKTFLIYCFNPQGILDVETPTALALAQKVRGFTTRATVGRWCPRAAETEIRQEIMDLQAVMMSLGESDVDHTHRLAELNQNLQMVKNQSWERRREESKRLKEKRSTPHSSASSREGRGQSDRLKYLQDQLRAEMEKHIREGKTDVETVQRRVTRIQELKEALREEALKNTAVPEKPDLSQASQLEYNKAKERRRQLKEDHGRLIQELVETMERDLAREQLAAEDPERELLVLSRERQVLVMQMEALRIEALQAETDLEDQYLRHQKELNCLREESLQVLRMFRQVSEEQREQSEGRYRNVLLEAVQDAVHLSAQNEQLRAENRQLQKALGELKDALAVRADPEVERTNQQ